MKNFKNLKIWQKGFDIAVKVLKLIKTFPAEERFGISFQLSKAAVSITSNIAEGSSRSSERDYGRFIEISLGSSFEVESQLLIARAINYGNEKEINDILEEIDEEQKMLISFRKSLQL